MATDTSLRPGELKNILLHEIQAADLAADDVSEVGTVLEVRDGVARIYGLNSAVASEMLEFTAQETGEVVTGLVLNLEEERTGEVREMALEMAWIFQAQGIAREALAALSLFCEAAGRETATVELARQVSAEIEKARRSAPRPTQGARGRG